MKVYLAGERSGSEDFDPANPPDDHWIRWTKRRLFSYYYHGFQNHNMPTRDVDATRGLGLDMFLDSGAFTAFSKGAVIDVDRYAEYIHRTNDYWTVNSCLDAIGDAQGSWDNLKALESQGCNVAPVFHCREDVSWLVKYLDHGYDYILLGGMVPESTRWLHDWLDWLWGDYLTNDDGTPRVKVHGFGLTDQFLMFRYPWYSVDSSSWLMTGIFGSCVFSRPEGLRKIVFSEDSPDAKRWTSWHYDRLTPAQQAEIRTWIAKYNITPDQLAQSYKYRDTINAATFTEMEPRGAKTFHNEMKGLFDA